MTFSRLLHSLPGGTWRGWLYAVVIVAVLARLVYSFGVVRGLGHVEPQFEATDGYHLIAESVHSGHGYTFDAAKPPTLTRPPGYVGMLLAVFSATGVNYAAVQVVQALLGGLTCWLLFLFGRWVLSPGLGLIAALFFALYPNALAYSSRLYSESLYYALFVGFAYLLCRASLEGSVRRGIAAGLVWGASVLTRATLMPLPFLLPFGLMLSPVHRKPYSRWMRWSIPALLTGLAVVAPWTVRNYLASGHFVPVTSWAWSPMFEGNDVGKHMGEWRDLAAYSGQVARSLGERASEIAAERGQDLRASTEGEILYDGIAKELVMADWRGDPLGLIARVGKGVAFAWFFVFEVKERAISVAIHAPIFLLFVSGAVLLWRRNRDAFWRAWPALGLILFVNALHAVAYAHVRYLGPAITIAFIFAALPPLMLIRTLRAEGAPR